MNLRTDLSMVRRVYHQNNIITLGSFYREAIGA